MVNYQIAKIYKITNDVDNEIYVGSTAKQYLSQRMTKHKESYKNRFLKGKSNMLLYQHVQRLGGFNHFNILLLENYPCTSKDELMAREGYWIKHLRASLNHRVEGRTKQEYYLDNSERIKAHVNAYRNTNRTRINEVKAQTYDCICGSKYTNCHKKRHMDSPRHQLYMQFGELNLINI